MDDISTLRQSIEDLRADLNTVTAKNAELATDLATANSRAEDLQKQITDLTKATTDSIAAIKVTDTMLENNAVTVDKIKDESVTNKKIAKDAVSIAQLDSGLRSKLNGFQPKGDYLVRKQRTLLKGGRLVIDTTEYPHPPAEPNGYHSRNVLEFKHNKDSGPATIIVSNGNALAVWARETGMWGGLVCNKVHAPSDMTLKHNIAQLESTLDRLEQVRGVTFEWNERYDPTQASKGQRQVGVLAQEVEAAFPEFATDDSPTDYKTVDYGRLVPILIEALKELGHEKDGQIEDLRAQVKALQVR